MTDVHISESINDFVVGVFKSEYSFGLGRMYD